MKRCVLGKTALFHPLFQKKKDPNGAVLNGTVGLILPLDTRGRGRRRFPSLAFLFPFSSKQLKKMPTKLPTCLPHGKRRGDAPLWRFWGGYTVAAPTTLPLWQG